MSEYPSGKPKVLMPTLVSNFNYAVNEVLERMNDNNIVSAWVAIETLYNILPPEIFKKVKQQYASIRSELKKSQSEGVSYEEMVHNYDEGQRVLGEYAVPFFRRCYELLYDGGYLEKPLVQPRFTGNRKLIVDSDES